MITKINEFKLYLEHIDRPDADRNVIDAYYVKFNDKLKAHNMELKTDKDHQDDVLTLNGKIIGELRLLFEYNTVIVEMILLNDDYQKMGIGTNIYQAALDAAIESGMDGLFSYAFDQYGTGQQRSPGATALLMKLVKKNGGDIMDGSDHVDEEDIQKKKAEGREYFGAPYYDIKIDKSGTVKGPYKV